MVITLVFALLGYAMIPWLVEFGLQLWRVKQSNSWNILKLILPSFSWEIISGWANHSGKVTIYKISKNKIDNHGSKFTIIKVNIVLKEQRVNDSWYGINLPYLRYTLTGFERNYQIRILSNQIKKNFLPLVYL